MNESYLYKFYEGDCLIISTRAETLTGALKAPKFFNEYRVVHQYPFFAVLQDVKRPERFIGVSWKPLVGVKARAGK